ncbi:MAG: tetratricopeptide repeat protein, partial [Alphaproteobacteria bacterium]|nr:tetratricopeptide repeat protein [Alphaproteobacteria bacterium]
GAGCAETPDDAGAFRAFGASLAAQNRLAEAADALGRAAALDPRNPLVHNDHGGLLHDLDRLDAAEAAYRRALACDPDFAPALGNLGTCLQAQGRLDEAAMVLERAVACAPDDAAAHSNLGTVREAVGRIDDAIAAFARAVALAPADAEFHSHLGNALLEAARLDEALAAHDHAAALAPGSAMVHNNRALALKEKGRGAEAEAACRHAIALDPALAEPHANLGNFLYERGYIDEARAAYDRAIDLADAAGRRAPIGPFFYLQLATDPARHRRIALSWSKAIAAAAPAPITARTRADKGARDRRLRIGYVSADFRAHAVAQTIGDAFRQHDRDRFEIIAYAYGPDDGSDYRGRIAASVDRFTDIAGLSDATAARRIAEDGIDILVDLNGFTQGTRLEIHAQRPAPVQVTGIGYPGTTGAPFFDYLIVDPVLIPPDDERFYTERIVRLPHFYMPSDRAFERACPATTRAAEGLPDEAMIFASFHQPSRIEPVIFAA